MPRSYIPPRDTDFDNWLRNFSTLITAAPATYGLAPADAVTIAAAYTGWHAAYLLAKDPTTRTRVTIDAKDTEKASVLPVIRAYAQQIKQDNGVLDSDKIAIGVPPKNSGRAPVPPPTSNPVLVLIASQTGDTTLRYYDSALGAQSRAKPIGAVALQIFRAIATDVVTDPSLMTFVGVATKSPFHVPNTPAEAGNVASYAATWQTRRGLVGPFSPPISGFLI